MLSRRSVLTGAAATVLATGARAATVGFCVVGRDGWLFSAFDGVWQTDQAPLHAVTATITEAVATLRRAKIDVAISLTPCKSRVYREFLPADLHWSPQAEKRYDLGVAELRRAGAVVPDQAALLATLRRERPGDDLFFKADTHWTGTAAEAAATLMARQIASQPLLPRSDRPGLKLASATPVLQERNDLAAMLPPGQREQYPLQNYELRQSMAADGAALLEDDSADVLVVGNSFMQPAYGYAAVLSQALDRPIGLSWKVHQFSPYWMLLNTLRNDPYKTRRPRLIVWNFEEPDLDTPSSTAGAWGQTAMAPDAFLTGLRAVLGG